MTPIEDPQALLRTLLLPSGKPLSQGNSQDHIRAALQRADAMAREEGLVVLSLGLQDAAEAREFVGVLAAIAQQAVRFGRATAPTLILSAGPVQVGGKLAGAAALALALALALDAHPAIHACAVGAADTAATDTSPNFGEFISIAPDTVAQAIRLGLAAGTMLVQHRARELFERLGRCDSFAPWDGGASVLRGVLLT